MTTERRAGEARPREGCHPFCAWLGSRYVHSALCVHDDHSVGTEPISPTEQPRADVSRDGEQVSSPPFGPDPAVPRPSINEGDER